MNKRNRPSFSFLKQIAAINVFIFPVLLTAYFILHENNTYFGLIPIPLSLKIFGYYSLFIALAAVLSMYVLKSQPKAFLFLVLLTAILLFFGAVQDIIKTLPVTAFLKKYRFLLCLVLLIVAGFFIFLKRSKKDFSAAGKFIQITLSILVVWELVILVMHVSSGKAKENILFQKTQESLSPASVTAKAPNIYFIVFDGFTSSRCLQEEFGYNNAELDSFLYKKGFYVVTNSKSNYPITPYSIASTLNFSYLADSLHNQELTAKDILQGMATVSQSRLMPYLEARGYTIINHSVFNLHKHPASGKIFFNDMAGDVFVNQTLPGRFNKDILWNFTYSPKDHSIKSKYLQAYVYDKLNGLRSAAAEKTAAPKFVYCHLMLPHEPYLFNKDGTLKLDSPMYRPHFLKRDYLDQLIYSRQVVKEVIKTIFDKDTLNKIVIMEGDHGFRDFGDPGKINRFFDNLNAIYFYDKNYSALYDSMTPVNTFRVVLNQFFNEKLSYLPDTSIYINDYHFDVGQARKN